MVRLPGFEPGSSTWQTIEIDWIMFKEYVEKDHKPRVAQQICSNAEKYADCLIKKDLSVIRDLGDTVRSNAMKGLSALAKFLGCYDEYRQLIKAYGLKWVGKSADDLFIERLTKIADPEEIWQWIRNVKMARVDLAAFMDLLAVTGLRLSEAVAAYNLIIKLAADGKLGSYYKAETSALEHFRFKDIFIRNSKKAFVSFVPQDLVQRVTQCEPLVNADSVKVRVKKRGLPQRFSDVREAHATYMIKFLKREEIDFLHGRVTSGVFMQHYFNPALIGDLQARVFQGIVEILEKVKI